MTGRSTIAGALPGCATCSLAGSRPPKKRATSSNGRMVAELPQSIWNSAVVSLGTTLLTLPLGGLAGYGLARFSHLRFMRDPTPYGPPVQPVLMSQT